MTMQDNNELYIKELEALTNKVLSGDITPVVFDLLADTKYLDSLYRYLTGGNFSYGDNNNDTDTAVREEGNDRPCFKEWFRNFERL